jgi:hypothetical protein
MGHEPVLGRLSRTMPIFRRPVLLLLLFLVPAHPVSAAAPGGTISGIVLSTDGAVLPGVSVLLPGSSLGAITDGQGQFALRNVPPGNYTIKALKMGFESQEKRGIAVTSGAVITVNFSLRETAVMRLKEITVEGQRKFINKESSTTRQTVRRQDLESLPVDTIKEAIGLKAGVVLQAGELHFRGGRGNEVLFQIDGIPVRDPLGGRTVDVAAGALAEAEALLGGLDAEYGNAQSGVVNISTREGGPRFSGEVAWSTDDYGAPDKTYDNFDRVEVAFGGPAFTPRFTYFLSFQGTFQDTYLKTAEQRPRRTFLDFISAGPRQNNDYNLQGKLAFTPGANQKLTFEVLDNQNRRDDYSHIFSRDGYVQARYDTLEDDGQIVLRYGRFSAEREDSTFVRYNAAEHTPDVREGFDQFKTVWSHTISSRTWYTVKISRHRFSRVDQVLNKSPWEYEGRYPAQWRNSIDGAPNLFFATNGDMPLYSDRNSSTWTGKADWTSAIGNHKFKGGIEGIYNDLSLLYIKNPVAISADGTIGSARSQYHNYSSEGSFYLQDQWTYEGMVLNAGGRVDMFSVGNQLDVSEASQPIRRSFSPRIGIAYPVSDRDVFSGHYGRFSQLPSQSAIFENRNADVLTRGNPDLESQTTISYQVGLQHQFAPDIYGQFSVYYKDIFGLLAIDEVAAGDDPEKFNQYVNRDYASARGFELTLEKRFSHNFSLDFSYGYGLATGVASDPEQSRVDGLEYLPIAEQPLDWDQRHTFSARFTITSPGDWLGTFLWSYGSGFPFTPTRRNDRKIDPATINTGRLPSVAQLNLQFEKHYTIYGQDMKLFIRGDNVLDSRTIINIEPDRFPVPPGVPENIYEIFYSETGRAGGAYMGSDVNGDGIDDWIPVNDPRVFNEGRSIRVGVGLKF